MKLLAYHNGDCVVRALADEPGRAYTRLVWIDAPVRVHKVPNEFVARYSRPDPNPRTTPEKAARRMLKAGRSLGITKSARQFLKGVK